MSSTKRKIIDEIKSRWPSDWKWDKKARCWTSSIGQVRRCAALQHLYDGDDENFVIQIWFYPKNGMPERLW